jgi:5-methylcytosine-specific restriction endonuclease McrA
MDQFRERTDRGGRRYKCLDCEVEMRRERYLNNRDYYLALASARAESDHDAYIEYQRRYRHENRDRLKEQDRWRRKNDYRYQAICLRASHERRARERNAFGSFTRSEWVTLLDAYSHTCLSCLKSDPEVKLTADHVVPLVKGGSNTIDNIQPLCGPCNSSKGTKIIDYRPQWQEQKNPSITISLPQAA